mmetsp:Transcript_60147/g.143363  ORF Transcript_60147/g.143363 Transcript_60147/m.143363 type:complete len:474 (-) Transcript_60147:28-1449(-)
MATDAASSVGTGPSPGWQQPQARRFASTASLFGEGEDQHFHEGATFVGVWLLVVLVGVHTLSAMKEILEPLLWALFLMAGLTPLTDRIEAILLWISDLCFLRCSKVAVQDDALRDVEDRGRDEAEPLNAKKGGGDEGSGGAGAERRPRPRFATGQSNWEEDDASAAADHEGCQAARGLASVIVVTFFVCLLMLFTILIYKSATYMQANWHHYEEGANKNLRRAHKIYGQLFASVPEEVVTRLSKKALETLQEALSTVLSALVSDVSNTAIEFAMMLLYMLFWLCSPVPLGPAVGRTFKRYIWLKSQASVGYAVSCWLILHFLNVDLAIVFGLVTFLFNWVPEVGPFLAMVLPIPLILMDGRIESPFIVAALALGGQLAMKFFFGNIIEVKLIERDRLMRLHPVVTLFFVAFFGWIWGATGMLLSVPIAAAVKASTPALPNRYRDTILIILEGDLQAPRRFQKLLQHERTESFG